MSVNRYIYIYCSPIRDLPIWAGNSIPFLGARVSMTSITWTTSFAHSPHMYFSCWLYLDLLSLTRIARV